MMPWSRIVWVVVMIWFSGTVFAQEPAPAPAPAPEATPAPPAPEAAPAPPPAPTPIDQVQLQVWIGETNEKDLGNIGADLKYTRFVRGVEQSGSLQQVSTSVLDTKDMGSVVLPAPDQTLFPPPMRPDEDTNLTNGVQAPMGAGLVANIIDSDYGTIDAVFRGRDRHSDLDLISKPELIVVNAAEATIQAGGKVPFQDIKYELGRYRLVVSWKDIGVNMKITPTILPDRNFVKLAITQLEVSDVARMDNIRGVDLPVISKRSQTGEVIVPNGETLVIGGLSNSLIRRTDRRVPVVGKLPIIGIPFRGRKTDATNTTLLIFVSPVIVDLRQMSKETVQAAEFWKEWKDSKRIEEEIKTLEMPDQQQ